MVNEKFYHRFGNDESLFKLKLKIKIVYFMATPFSFIYNICADDYNQ